MWHAAMDFLLARGWTPTTLYNAKSKAERAHVLSFTLPGLRREAARYSLRKRRDSRHI